MTEQEKTQIKNDVLASLAIKNSILAALAEDREREAEIGEIKETIFNTIALFIPEPFQREKDKDWLGFPSLNFEEQQEAIEERWRIALKEVTLRAPAIFEALAATKKGDLASAKKFMDKAEEQFTEYNRKQAEAEAEAKRIDREQRKIFWILITIIGLIFWIFYSSGQK